MCPPTLRHHRRELARRVSGGIEVTLYWCAAGNSTSIELWQPASEERLAFAVPREHALDAFYHPFAHPRMPSGAWSRVHAAGARR